MLDRLPAEIIDHILLLAAPPPRLDDFSQDSHKTLSRCCMVSKVLRERAQPLLWRDVTLWRPEQFEAFVKLRPQQETDEAGEDDEDADRLWRLCQATRVLRLQDVDTAALISKVDNGLFTLLADPPPFLVSLDVEFDSHGTERAFRLSELALAAPVLRSLKVYNARLLDAAPVFPALVSLYLDFVRDISTTFSAILCHSTLPALRRLGLIAMDGDEAFKPLSAQFLSQLEVLEVDEDGLRYIPDDLQQKPFALVIDWMSQGEHHFGAEILSSSTAPSLHLHLTECQTVLPFRYSEGTVSDVIAAFSALPRPRAFHFPPPPSPDDPEAASIQSCLDKLTAACLAKGIKVFGPDEDVWDAIKRMMVEKEKKEKEEAEQA